MKRQLLEELLPKICIKDQPMECVALQVQELMRDKSFQVFDCRKKPALVDTGQCPSCKLQMSEINLTVTGNTRAAP